MEREAAGHQNPGDELYPVMVRAGPMVHMAWTAKEGLMYCKSVDAGKTWNPTLTLTPKGGLPFIATANDAVYLMFRSQRDGHPAIYFKRDLSGGKVKDNEAKSP